MISLSSIALAACIVAGTTISADAEDRLVLVGASYGKNVLAICDSDGKVIWKHNTAAPQKGHAGHHDVHLLPSGNILFHDSWTKTQEITLGKQVVWEISKTVPDSEITLGWMTALQELPNGNIVAGNCHAGEENPQIFEITKDKNVVWEFDEWDLVGNGLACWQILDAEQSAMVRKQLAALKK
ncbi:MAG: hypothetical protein GY903_18300 [Fuerstiella sp.]|nr:hypothetical protein [Fuerstiella sp.]MCP4856438.1 hypothetical protein [Fuerstiella sp.]